MLEPIAMVLRGRPPMQTMTPHRKKRGPALQLSERYSYQSPPLVVAVTRDHVWCWSCIGQYSAEGGSTSEFARVARIGCAREALRNSAFSRLGAPRPSHDPRWVGDPAEIHVVD